jgi:hypothetical protein
MGRAFVAVGATANGGGGRNRTHRTGVARPTRVEDEEGHQTLFTSAEIIADVPARWVVVPPIQCRDQPAEEVIVKKLLLLLVLVALGAAVARKVRAA